jgi:hypothetical protein
MRKQLVHERKSHKRSNAIGSSASQRLFLLSSALLQRVSHAFRRVSDHGTSGEWDAVRTKERRDTGDDAARATPRRLPF